MCSRISWCFGKSYFVQNFRAITTTLNDTERNFINLRYLRIIKNLEETTKRSAFFYYIFSGIVTAGSIIVPSLISIQDRSFKYNATEEEKNKHSNNVYWTVWGISISVTLANAFIKLLRLDQTFISRNLRLNQLRSEGVMFTSAIGDYSCADQEDCFRLFVTNVEKIKNLQMYQEFTQNGEITRETNNLVTLSQQSQRMTDVSFV
jgi:hypothetical protein